MTKLNKNFSKLNFYLKEKNDIIFNNNIINKRERRKKDW